MIVSRLVSVLIATLLLSSCDSTKKPQMKNIVNNTSATFNKLKDEVILQPKQKASEVSSEKKTVNAVTNAQQDKQQKAKKPTEISSELPFVRLRSLGDSSYFVQSIQTVSEVGANGKSGMAVAIAYSDRKCLLLTSYHVVSDSESLHLSPWIGNDFLRNHLKDAPAKNRSNVGSILWSDSSIDVALISFDSPKPCPIAQVASQLPELGVDIYTFEQPAKGKGSYKKGIVSGYWIVPEFGGASIVANLNVVSGGSGGGVFNEKNELIGVNIAKSVNKKGFTFISPIQPVLRALGEKNIIELSD